MNNVCKSRDTYENLLFANAKRGEFLASQPNPQLYCIFLCLPIKWQTKNATYFGLRWHHDVAWRTLASSWLTRSPWSPRSASRHLMPAAASPRTPSSPPWPSSVPWDRGTVEQLESQPRPRGGVVCQPRVVHLTSGSIISRIDNSPSDIVSRMQLSTLPRLSKVIPLCQHSLATLILRMAV